jgi:hypothetical protein
VLSIPKYQRIVLGCVSVVVVGLAGYFAGRAAQIKFVDMLSDKTPPPDAKLEQEGRYEEAIQVLLSPNRERPIQPEDYSRVAFLYLEWAKKDSGNRVNLAHKSASYSEKSVQIAPNDPFVLETALNNLDRAGDYLENGCPYYEEAQTIGEKVLVLTEKETVNVRGMSYPTQQFKESVPYFLKRVRAKVKAWCNKP